MLAWNVDPHTPAGKARLCASAINALAAGLTLLNGPRLAARVSAIERGQYPRLRAGATERITECLQGETPQTVTIAGEGGDDIREVAAVLVAALQAAGWHVHETNLGGSLWNGGRGIMIRYTAQAAAAGNALIEALKDEGLPVSYAAEPSTGMPVHIRFRRR